MAKKKTNHLTVVNSDQTRASDKRFADQEQREKEEKSWRLMRHEVKLRVKEIRGCLEQFDKMVTGLPFDIIHPCEPPSIRGRDWDKTESSELAERLVPRISFHFKRLQKHLYDTDEWDLAEGVLGPMKWAVADVSFAIGVLAGAIYADAPAREIDRFEKGLYHAITARFDEIKD